MPKKCDGWYNSFYEFLFDTCRKCNFAFGKTFFIAA